MQQLPGDLALCFRTMNEHFLMSDEYDILLVLHSVLEMNGDFFEMISLRPHLLCILETRWEW